jgi:uncharacterized protein YbjT (DUF2867 family)
MTNVLILGANGQLARNTTRVFIAHTDARLKLYLRRAKRSKNPDASRVETVEGDVLDARTLLIAMHGQDVVRVLGQNGRLVNAGDHVREAVSALRRDPRKRVI